MKSGKQTDCVRRRKRLETVTENNRSAEEQPIFSLDDMKKCENNADEQFSKNTVV